MKVLELFAGTRSISKAFEARGHETFCVEWNQKFPNIDLYADVSTLTAQDIIGKFGRPDVIWASPDCTTYSVCGLARHREPITFNPRTQYAKFCDECNRHLIKLIHDLDPKLYFIENPRGVMRKMDWTQDLPRYTVTYCQYGDKRQKPTDIWTNHPNPKFRPPCKPRSPCHESAPRGTSKTGTQSLKNKIERSKIPNDLCFHIVDICETHLNPRQNGDDLETL